MNPVLRKVLFATSGLWDPLWIASYRLQHGYRGAIPPFKNRDRVGARDIGWFLEGGRLDYAVFKEALDRHSNRPLSELSLLDFGAGCGRILQHFRTDGPRLFAADVDASAVAYLQRTFPDVHALCNQWRPPLDLPAASLDAVYAYSVWTHLPLREQEAWMAEMHRLLKADGLLLLSFLGFYGLKLLRESQNPHEAAWRDVSNAQLEAQGVIYHEYANRTSAADLFPGITGSYGVAVHAPSYMRRQWAPDFAVLALRERALHGHQDLLVLRRI